MASVNNESCFSFSHEFLGRGLPWPLASTCHPDNSRNSGAHGKPVAQSPSQIRLLTSWKKKGSEVSTWQLGEERGLNNQSLWMDVIGDGRGRSKVVLSVTGWMDTRTFCTLHADNPTTALLFDGRREAVGSAELPKWHLIPQERKLFNLSWVEPETAQRVWVNFRF